MTAGRRLALALVAAGLAALAAVPATRTEAAPPPIRIAHLQLLEGSDWRAEDGFNLRWDLEVPAGAATPATVHYRLSREGGQQLEEGWPQTTGSAQLWVQESGAYVAEIWAVDSSGQDGPPASVILRLDHERPGSTTPLAPTGWIAGGAATHLRLTHPTGLPPLSGLGGYAVSVDADRDGTPCASAIVCAPGEIDLPGGAGDDSLVLAALPEGRLYAHALAVSGTGVHSAAVGTTPLRVDATSPEVELERVPAGWATGPVRVRARASDVLSGMGAAGADGAFTAISVDGATPRTEPGDTATAVVAGDGAHRVEAQARDLAGNCSATETRPPLRATVRIDGSAPRVAFANRRPATGRQALVATVADPLSGPSPSLGTIGFRPARTRQRLEPLPTAIEGDRLLAEWNGAEHPAGTYELAATAYDRAGNVATSSGRADGTQMLVVGLGKARTRLRARLVGGRRGQTLPLGRGGELSGRLSTANGRPLAGLEIAIHESFDPGSATARRLASVRTDGRGRFRLPLAAGPSRAVAASFPGDAELAPSTAPLLRLLARAGVRMGASARFARIGGRPIVFRGRVLPRGAKVPREGLPVELQFRLPGLPWSEFRTVASDRRGRFRYRYAFADDDSRGARFQFRAVVRERDGWPYATGSSRPLAVTGR